MTFQHIHYRQINTHIPFRHHTYTRCIHPLSNPETQHHKLQLHLRTPLIAVIHRATPKLAQLPHQSLHTPSSSLSWFLLLCSKNHTYQYTHLRIQLTSSYLLLLPALTPRNTRTCTHSPNTHKQRYIYTYNTQLELQQLQWIHSRHSTPLATHSSNHTSIHTRTSVVHTRLHQPFNQTTVVYKPIPVVKHTHTIRTHPYTKIQSRAHTRTTQSWTQVAEHRDGGKPWGREEDWERFRKIVRWEREDSRDWDIELGKREQFRTDRKSVV